MLLEQTRGLFSGSAFDTGIKWNYEVDSAQKKHNFLITIFFKPQMEFTLTIHELKICFETETSFVKAYIIYLYSKLRH